MASQDLTLDNEGLVRNYCYGADFPRSIYTVCIGELHKHHFRIKECSNLFRVLKPAPQSNSFWLPMQHSAFVVPV